MKEFHSPWLDLYIEGMNGDWWNDTWHVSYDLHMPIWGVFMILGGLSLVAGALLGH